MRSYKKYYEVILARVLFEDYPYVEQAGGRVLVVPALGDAIYVDKGDMEAYFKCMADIQLFLEKKTGVQISNHPDRMFVTDAPKDSKENLLIFIEGGEASEDLEPPCEDQSIQVTELKEEN